MILAIHREKQKLDNLFVNIKDVEEMEMKAHWAKYLCVLTSGYIENSIRHIISDYASNKAAPPLANFIQRKIKRVTNLKHKNIISLMEEFDENWKNKYLDKVTEEQSDAINSVVANRHLIAHGRNVGITYVTIKNYYSFIVPAVELIYDIINEE